MIEISTLHFMNRVQIDRLVRKLFNINMIYYAPETFIYGLEQKLDDNNEYKNPLIKLYYDCDLLRLKRQELDGDNQWVSWLSERGYYCISKQCAELLTMIFNDDDFASWQYSLLRYFIKLSKI